VLDLAVEYSLVDKRGAYFRYGETLLGQGRENAKTFLAENPAVLDELEYLIRREVGLPTDEFQADGEVLAEPVGDATF
jgi:recombination protein RecA